MARRSTLLLLPLLMLLSGCASTLNKGRASFELLSEPPGAAVFVNGQERGATPYRYFYLPADGEEVKIELRKDGYQSRGLDLRPRMANGVLFVDAMLFQLPYAVDRNSPDLYRIPVKEHTVVLRKEIPADQKRWSMPVARVDVGITDREVEGKIGNKKLGTVKNGPGRALQYPDDLARSVVNGLKGSWMDALHARQRTQKGDEAIRRAKMYLVARVTGMRATLTGDERRCNGPVELDVEWKLFGSSNDSVLYTRTNTVVYHALQERPADLLNGALELAAVRLSEVQVLPEVVARSYGSGLTAAKGSAYTLVRPKPVSFNGRKEMLSALVKAVVTISTDNGHGSGFLISNDGYMLTNHHVVDDKAMVKVKFEQGFTLDAQVLKVNEDFDLALLKVEATDLPALAIGSDAQLMLGEELFAIGTPLDAALGQSVSRGILSGKRDLDGRTFLQTDVSINPGNSGGPVVDENGTVVGVATMKISGAGVEGIGFAVPISQALDMLNVSIQ
jgi:S1-C subfamily serine protease